MTTRPGGPARRSLAATVAVFGVLLLVLVPALAACTGPAGDRENRSRTLHVAAGSEIRDLEPLLAEAGRAVGVTVALDYVGTLDGTEQLASGRLGEGHAATWFASNRYLSLEPAAAAHVVRAEKTMSSPVALGLRRPVAERLGWADRQPTWAEIGDAAAAGRFTYGMTDPASSNSGFSALVSVATAFADTGSALTEADVETVRPRLTGFFSAQKATAGSSGWLADEFASGRAPVDGIVNYESVLGRLDTSRLGDPLRVIVPSDGVVTADYPLALLDSADEESRSAYDDLVGWLTTPDVQRRIAADTGRRPAVPGVAPPPASGPGVVVEQPFPATLGTVQALLSSFVNEVRKPSQTVYAVDVSGSMAGERIGELRSALNALAGADPSASGRLTAFRNREKVTLLPFSSEVRPPVTVEFPRDGDRTAQQGRVRDAVAALDPGGQTALYSAVDAALAAAGGQRDATPDSFTSVVLMTDGLNNTGISRAELMSRLDGASVRGIPVFVVLFGEAGPQQLEPLAAATGGKVFDARTQDLTAVFKEIRGYQ